MKESEGEGERKRRRVEREKMEEREKRGRAFSEIGYFIITEEVERINQCHGRVAPRWRNKLAFSSPKNAIFNRPTWDLIINVWTYLKL